MSLVTRCVAGVYAIYHFTISSMSVNDNVHNFTGHVPPTGGEFRTPHDPRIRAFGPGVFWAVSRPGMPVSGPYGAGIGHRAGRVGDRTGNERKDALLGGMYGRNVGNGRVYNVWGGDMVDSARDPERLTGVGLWRCEEMLPEGVQRISLHPHNTCYTTSIVGDTRGGAFRLPVILVGHCLSWDLAIG